MVDCCGAPALWSGRRALHDEVTAGLRETWRSLGEPQIVTACSTCLKTLGEFLPEMKARSLWTVIDEIGWPDGARPHLAVRWRFTIPAPAAARSTRRARCGASPPGSASSCANSAARS